MKMKEIGPKGGHASLAPPLDPPMVVSIVLLIGRRIVMLVPETEFYNNSWIGC